MLLGEELFRGRRTPVGSLEDRPPSKQQQRTEASLMSPRQ